MVGYAGLLDLGYVAFFAVGAYMYGLLASPHLTDAFPCVCRHVPGRAAHPPCGSSFAGGVPGGHLGILLGAPTLKLRGATTWPS